MKCPHCNQEHPADFQFCPRTGKKTELLNKACTNKQCSAYGKYVLPLDAIFCPNCGCSIVNNATNEEHTVEDKKLSETEKQALDSYFRSVHGISWRDIERKIDRAAERGFV